MFWQLLIFDYKVMCFPGGGDQHDEIPTLSARIEEKQKRSQDENVIFNFNQNV